MKKDNDKKESGKKKTRVTERNERQKIESKQVRRYCEKERRG